MKKLRRTKSKRDYWRSIKQDGRFGTSCPSRRCPSRRCACTSAERCADHIACLICVQTAFSFKTVVMQMVVFWMLQSVLRNNGTQSSQGVHALKCFKCSSPITYLNQTLFIVHAVTSMRSPCSLTPQLPLPERRRRHATYSIAPLSSGRILYDCFLYSKILLIFFCLEYPTVSIGGWQHYVGGWVWRQLASLAHRQCHLRRVGGASWG